jgi:hypothetical protein
VLKGVLSERDYARKLFEKDYLKKFSAWNYRLLIYHGQTHWIS